MLRTAVVGPSVSTAAYGDVDALLCAATYDPASGDLVIFAVNRGRAAPIELSTSLAAFRRARLVEHLLLHDENSSACNTEADPDRVVPRVGGAELADDTLTAVLPPVSWHCFRLREGTS